MMCLNIWHSIWPSFFEFTHCGLRVKRFLILWNWIVNCEIAAITVEVPWGILKLPKALIKESYLFLLPTNSLVTYYYMPVYFYNRW